MTPLDAIGGTLCGLTIGWMVAANLVRLATGQPAAPYIVALMRAMAPDPAETAWVRLVVDQLDAHGVWDDGVLVVYIGPSPYAGEHGALGWTVRVDGRRPVWTSSRAELLERLRNHYRTSRQCAAEEAR